MRTPAVSASTVRLRLTTLTNDDGTLTAGKVGRRSVSA